MPREAVTSAVASTVLLIVQRIGHLPVTRHRASVVALVAAADIANGALAVSPAFRTCNLGDPIISQNTEAA